jgi:ferritin-like metal-binding protein YciE
MKEETFSITTLNDLLDYNARRFTSAEIQLKNHLPGWINQANSLQLKSILLRYVDFITDHVKKLETFVEKESIKSISLSNRVMKSFIEDADEKLAGCTDIEVKDACLLECVQAINHFKVSMYGTAAAFSKALGMEKEAAVFHLAEVNEKQIDDRLSQLAEHEINRRAKAPLVIPG